MDRPVRKVNLLKETNYAHQKIEVFLANAGLRNYLFIRLTADIGFTGIGEASFAEWRVCYV